MPILRSEASEAALGRRETAPPAQQPVVAAGLGRRADPARLAPAPPIRGGDAPLPEGGAVVDRCGNAVGRGVVAIWHSESKAEGEHERGCSGRNPAGHHRFSFLGRGPQSLRPPCMTANPACGPAANRAAMRSYTDSQLKSVN